MNSKKDLINAAQAQVPDMPSVRRAMAEMQLEVLNALPACTAVLDSDGVIVTVCDAWRHHASTNALQVGDISVGHNYLRSCELATGESYGQSAAVAQGIRDVLGGSKEIFTCEYPCHVSDEKRWFQLTVTPFKSSLDSGAVVMLVNITDQHKAEDALREETRMLELLNKAGRELASNLDLHSAVQAVTDAGTQIIGAHFGAFFYNATDSNGGSMLLYTLSGAPRSAFEHFGYPRPTPLFGPMFRGEPAIRSDDVTKDPRYGKMAPHHGLPAGHLPVRSYLSVPVVSRSGEVIGALFFGHPQPGMFTERSQRIMEGLAAQAAVTMDNARLYETVTKLNDDLEDRVRRRTLQLEAANKELKAFSYSISHDLRAPLSTINGFSQLLLKSDGAQLSEKGAHYLNRICAGVVNMGKLIDGLWTLAQTSKATLNRGEVDLTTMSTNLVQELRDSEPDRVVDVQIQADLMINGDPAMVTVVMQNLLANAWKYSGKTPHARVVIGSETTANGLTCIFVQDNGVGFDMVYVDKLFETFHRLHQDTEFKGTGIGLANVKRVVERHGGRVWAESSPGEGTTFRFTLDCPP